MSIKLPKKGDTSIDMAPMIDMVFLLLIFFMVASKMTMDKPEVSLPVSIAGKEPKDTRNRVMVSVAANDDIHFGMVKLENLERLKDEIEREVDINSEVEIMIRADKDVEYKMCKDIMKVCAEAGAANLIYSTYEE